MKRRFAPTGAWALWSCGGLLSLASLAAGELAVLPDDILLNGSMSRQQIIVESRSNGAWTGDVTKEAVIESNDPGVARVEQNMIVPVSNGSATITARVGERTASVNVRVEGAERPMVWSFRNQVQPVLTKSGCNSGACHGAAAGQNGFRLSLRGFDDAGDYLALTRHAMGRRVNLREPSESLLLLKATGVASHKGGKRFDVDSFNFAVLAGWIAAGVPPPADERRIIRIETMPERVVLEPGNKQQILVRAHYDDGGTEDVTRWAKFSESNSSVAQVNADGLATVTGYGEGAITAWFSSRIAIVTVTVPFTNAVSAESFAQERNFIDEEVLTKLRDLNIPPSRRSTDAEFIRRVYLDTLGILPTADEVRRFTVSVESTKRDVLIDEVLERKEFVDYWAYKWSDLLLVNSGALRPPAMWAFYNWIRENVAANTGWDEFVRRIVVARGSTLENGAANFFVLHEDPKQLAETTSQAFLGMSINCAQCHNHPLEKWTNADYYSMANLFARVRKKNGVVDGENVVFVTSRGDIVQPLTGKVQPPRPLDGEPLSTDADLDRRAHLAEWLVSPDNPYFTRAIVNRVWANFFGVGLVESVDDLRATNPASNERLLQRLSDFLVAQRYDLRELMRAILQSDTYQRSSEPLAENMADERFYSRYYPRRLMAEVLLDALSQVTEVPTHFPGYPKGWRAVQLPDVNIESYFLETFGRPDRKITCACERTVEPSITQMLHISNGDTINKKLLAPENRISRWLTSELEPDQLVEEAYLTALSRVPRQEEKERMLEVIRTADPAAKRQVFEDLMWALVSSREFLFNH